MPVRRMSAADAELLYVQLVQHHRTCKVCTDKQDCPVGANLLLAWGRVDAAAHPMEFGDPLPELEPSDA